jgi:CHAT domain-containing protein
MLMAAFAFQASLFAAAPAAPAARDTLAFVAHVRALLASGRPADALQALATAGRALETAPAPVRVRAEILAARAHRALADVPAANGAAQTAFQRAERAKDPGLRVEAHLALSDLAKDRGDFERVGTLLGVAEPLAVRAAQASLLAGVLSRKAEWLRMQGRAQEALAAHGQALAAAEASDDRSLPPLVRTGRSVTRLGLADYDGALVDAQAGYELARQQDDKNVRALSIFGLAQAHAHIRNLETAAQLWTEAIEAYRDAGVQINVALALRQRMDTWFAMEDYDRAAADGEAALAQMERTGSGGTLEGLLARLALIEARRSRPDASEAYRARAAALLANVPDRRRVSAETDFGLVALHLGQAERARGHFEAVLAQARRLGDLDYEWRALNGLGRTARLQGHAREAQARLEAAIEVVERMRRMLPDASLRAAFLSDRLGPYDTLIQVLMDRGDQGSVSRALEVAERARGRALAEHLREARARAGVAELEAVRKQEKDFGRRLSDLQRRLAGAAPEGRSPLSEALAEAERDYESFMVRVRREHPAYAAVQHPRAPTADEVAAIPRKDEALLIFWLGRDRGFAWLAQDGALSSFHTPGAPALEARTRLLLAAVTARDERAVRELGTELHEQLVAPATTRLGRVSRLIVVPDGPLGRLPFALLRQGSQGALLVERHAIQQAPSAAVLRELRARPAGVGSGVLIVAASAAEGASPAALRLYPDQVSPVRLEQAEREAQEVAALTGAPREAVLVGPAATEAAFRGLAERAPPVRVVHVASHAVVDDAVPRRTAVILAAEGADDGLLQLNEITDLRLGADLVVLAACRSHLGRAVRSEGFVSLSRAFLSVGARGVVGTLWAVDDAATRRLMRAFYSRLRDGEAPSDALRAAQLEMIRSGGADAAAASWAAFVLSGEGSTPPFPASPRWRSPFVIAFGMALLAVWWKRRRPRVTAASGETT